MERINEFIINAQQFIMIASGFVSFLGIVFAGMSVFKKQSKRVIIILLISAICGGGICWYSSLLTRVPNVTGKTYKDAKQILIVEGFDFISEKGKDNYFVVKQDVEAGSVIIKGALINLVLEDKNIYVSEEEKEETINKIKKEGVRFFKPFIRIQGYQLSIQDNKGNTLTQIGSDIDLKDLTSFTLENEDYKLLYDEFEVVDNYDGMGYSCVTTKEIIPVGNYNMQIKVDGYEMFSSKVNLNSEVIMTDADRNIHAIVIPNRIQKRCSYGVFLVDESLESYNFQSCEVKLSKDSKESYGIEYINDGRFYLESAIGTEFWVDVTDFSGNTKSCRASFNAADDIEVYIMIPNNGEPYQMEYIDYLNGISK